jgi:DNA modification methylase
MTIQRFNTDFREYIAKLPSHYFQAIITDPPYDLDYPFLTDLLRVCSGNVIMFCAPEHQFFVPDEYAFWIKPSSTKNFSKHLGRFVEMILIQRQGTTFNSNLNWSNYTGTYDDRLLAKQVHPFEKPQSLIDRLVAIYTNWGNTIFDPFMGSGTTLRSCWELGRNAIGCEINPEYFKLSEGIGEL